tara:strand:+ start:2032 stop:2208 length:177 start_codon:yes stop_codon:yes gene_type:complete
MKRKIFAFLTLLPLVTLNSFVFSEDDEDPPKAPHEQGYDAFSHSPMGRVTTAAFKYSF